MPVDPLTRNNVTVTGNPEAGSVIVFVHGFGTDQRAWDAVAARFTADFRIVLLDNVGAGQSDRAAFVQHRYLNLDRYATDLNEVCDALGLDGAVLVGHSSGAMVCLLAAVAQPARFGKVVLVGASPRYLDADDYHGGFTRQDIDALYQSIAGAGPSWADPFASTMMGNADRPRLSLNFADAIKTIPKDQVLTDLCAILQSDYRSEIGKLAKPTLVVRTRNDKAVPLEVAQYLTRNIAGSRLTVIDAEGHLPHISAPDKVAAAIASFICA